MRRRATTADDGGERGRREAATRVRTSAGTSEPAVPSAAHGYHCRSPLTRRGTCKRSLNRPLPPSSPRCARRNATPPPLRASRTARGNACVSASDRDKALRFCACARAPQSSSLVGHHRPSTYHCCYTELHGERGAGSSVRRENGSDRFQITAFLTYGLRDTAARIARSLRSVPPRSIGGAAPGHCAVTGSTAACVVSAAAAAAAVVTK